MRPASPRIPCLLLNHPLFWLLFTGLIVTIVYVRKLEKPGDFPPLHYLLSAISMNKLVLSPVTLHEACAFLHEANPPVPY